MKPPTAFSYDEAFIRNIGWITEAEQLMLKDKKVAIAGMGGVGGVHLLTLTRLGIGAFHISDLDVFDIVNFNRQIGATVSTIGRPKVDVMAEMALDINPELSITKFAEGISDANIDAFLDGVDLFVDGFDFFVLDIRAKVFARCAERGIPAITAAPLGLGTGFLVFMPGGMTFEQYFRLQGLSETQQYVNFFMGLVPRSLQRTYLVDPRRLDIEGKAGPSSVTACQLCSGVVGVEALKILLDRGPVRAAPTFHQFDAYRGKWTIGKLRWGNSGPLQKLKLKAAYKGFAALSAQAWKPPARTEGPVIEQILDLARWAPSGDNTQPWSFEIESDQAVTIRVFDQAEDDVYDYNDGQPTLLSVGMLVENIRIAASAHGLGIDWTYEPETGHHHRIRLTLNPDAVVESDPLLPYLHTRSVDRKPYRTTPLGVERKRQLEQTLDDDLEILWFESSGERWAASRTNALSTDVRLRIPEAFHVHKRVLDWERNYSPTGIPARAVGVSPPTQMAMKWTLEKWSRADFMNRYMGATLSSRLEMDLIPGMRCAAHFAIAYKEGKETEADRAVVVRHGQSIQRFWLTATKMGLVMQPEMAALIFAFYGRNGVAFTEHQGALGKAAKLADRLEADVGGRSVNDLVFRGRIGMPSTRKIDARSIRKTLEELRAS